MVGFPNGSGPQLFRPGPPEEHLDERQSEPGLATNWPVDKLSGYRAFRSIYPDSPIGCGSR